ncbi:cell division protein FtsZ [Lutimonas zeaxanthinifaciens]|uniref:cell division protein FtsZ n=1 Tax=Lutimonas zeaxanthinifaciens TaxID=3060215 RepID=UPI00265CEB73|nr:cell division protein FtsZ [Lutimonas sp. YSD2104]WKK65386.1 cell division protein FtsZ [Lutimonas sp. YSD2104]
MSLEFSNLSFDLPKNQSNVIKVIGVGGGGSNAINHMYNKGIKGVDFVVCNTDAQALQSSPVPHKIQLGATLTEGLGAGANPEIGEQSAMESMEDIKNMLNTKSKMLFITVGMGGGTGTGAAPVIAKIAQELDILTVGIVTIPFSFEGKMRNEQAQRGIEKLRAHVDSLVVINNNKLREVYGNLGFKAGFSKADEVLSTAATGIAEVITHHYTQNIDLRDAKTVLSNSGTAIMGSAQASGSNRAQNAITKALHSPLLNDNKIEGSKNVLLLIVSGTSEVTIDEIGEINDYIQSEAKTNVDIIMGVGEDESLGDAISVTIIATGFNPEQQSEISKIESKKIVHKLVEEREMKVSTKTPPSTTIQNPGSTLKAPQKSAEPQVTRHILHEEGFIEEIKIKKTENKRNTPEPSNTVHQQPVTFEPVQPATTLNKEINPEIQDKKEIDNIPVQFEQIKPEMDQADFEITNVTPKKEEKEVIQEDSENQFSFTFDLPIQNVKKEEKKVFTSLEDININDIEIVGLEEIKPEPKAQPVEPVPGEDTIRHTLEDEFAAEINTLKSISESENIEDEDMHFELKVKNENVTENNVEEVIEDKDISPMNLTIAELRNRAEIRRKKMKDFNYKFINKLNHHIDEIESEPAYKRMGVDLDDVPASSESDKNKSRMTLGTDDNDEIQLRSNNSFLHDNVD